MTNFLINVLPSLGKIIGDSIPALRSPENVQERGNINVQDYEFDQRSLYLKIYKYLYEPVGIDFLRESAALKTGPVSKGRSIYQAGLLESSPACDAKSDSSK